MVERFGIAIAGARPPLPPLRNGVSVRSGDGASRRGDRAVAVASAEMPHLIHPKPDSGCCIS